MREAHTLVGFVGVAIRPKGVGRCEAVPPTCVCKGHTSQLL